MENTIAIWLRVSVELHHGVVRWNTRFEGGLAGHLLEQKLRGGGVADTAARSDERAVSDRRWAR